MDEFYLDLFGNLNNLDRIYDIPVEDLTDKTSIQPLDHTKNAGIEASVKDLSQTAVRSNGSSAKKRVLDTEVTATDRGAKRRVLNMGGMEELISLDSDDDDEASMAENFDRDNPELSIKIRWSGNYEKYILRKHQKFSYIMKLLAERESVMLDEIVLNLENKLITERDTPASIGYKIFHFLDGRVIKRTNVSSHVATNINEKIDGFHLMVQSEQMKQPIPIELERTDRFKIMYVKCAEELNVNISQLKLSYDGIQLKMNETPKTLGMACGEIIDVFIK